VPGTFATTMALVTAAFAGACSSSSGGGPTVVDASTVDVESQVGADASASDASEDVVISPVDTCSEAQLAFFINNMPCAQCVAQNCAALLRACTNCPLCQQQLSGCPACTSMCFGGGTGMPAFDSGL
jgi:hypothetical protein